MDEYIQELRIMIARGQIPKEIADFLYECFQIYEIRGRVGESNGVKFEVRTREQNHTIPHIHAAYGEYSTSIAIETGEVLAGNLPKKQQKDAVEWVLNKKEYLLGKWKDIAISAFSVMTRTRFDDYN